jgi:glycolate oxidase iron-sulfur subunit
VRDVAQNLARTNFTAFADQDFDAIVTNAAGCGSTLKEYPHLFPAGVPNDHAAHDQATRFTSKMRDVTEFLADLGLSAPLRALPLRVTYQDSCHLAHGQKIREAPRVLISAIPKIEIVEMRLADQRCGSAGIYNVTETKTSLQLLALKMDCVRETTAQVIVTANPGCILQLRAGAASHNTGQEVLHVMELLDRALASNANIAD